MAYFDNAATTYPKPDTVYQYMDEYYRSSGGSAGRGNHSMATVSGNLVAETRKLINELLHCPTKQVVFTPTATIALNMIIQGIAETGIRNVYVSPFEHNAVTRTLHHIEATNGIRINQLSVNKDFKYNLEAIRYQFDAVRPDLVIVSHASNVFGLIAPVEEICSLAKKHNATTLIDMAQTAGLVDCNVGLQTIDFAVFAGHKSLYGPTGISGFVMNPSIDLPAVLFGGTGYDSSNQDMPNRLPEKYEMGTLNTSGIAGLNAALKWIKETTIEKLWEKDQINRQKLIDVLSGYDFISIVGDNDDNEYVGIVSCLIDGISSDSAGSIFDKQYVSVRTGLQCAPLAHKFLGTYPAGTIRFSVSYFTVDEDFEALKQALDYIEENI
jgi:cysteine desulfurase family protein